jgi:hypothetical protein
MSYINNFLKTEPNENNKRYFDRLKKDFNTLINDLNKFEEDGELIKKEFSDLTSLVNKVKDSLYGWGIGTKSMIVHAPDVEKTAVEKMLYWDTPNNAAGLKKFIQLLEKTDISNESEKTKKTVEFALESTRELQEIRERVISLKENIVKKRKDVVQKEEDAKLKASHKDVMATKEHLDSIIEEVHKEVFDKNKQTILHRYEVLKNALLKDDLIIDRSYVRKGEEPKTAQKYFNFNELMLVANIKIQNFALKDKETLEKQADKEAEQIFQDIKSFYIQRVGSKVAVVLNHKNNLDTIETINIKTNSQIEAYLKFNFKDKSSFELSTQVEWASLPSDYTKQFMRVPTRFHNAITPDGEKHTDLSEGIIQDLFLKEYPDQDVKNFLKNKVEPEGQVSKNKSGRKP